MNEPVASGEQNLEQSFESSENGSKSNIVVILSIVLIAWGLISLSLAALNIPGSQSAINIWLFVGGFSLAVGFAMLSNHR